MNDFSYIEIMPREYNYSKKTIISRSKEKFQDIYNKSPNIIKLIDNNCSIKNKPPLISSKLPSVFELPKINNKIPIVNEIITEDKLYLEPLRIKKRGLENIIIKDYTIDEDRIENKISVNKLILKPIEIKDPRKKNKEKQIDEKNTTLTPYNHKELEKFSKTSNFNFKKIENIKLIKNKDITNEDNNEMSIIPEIERKVSNKIISEIGRKINNRSVLIAETKKKQDVLIKLEEMITLSIIDNSKSNGLVKKMLHVPSLKIYTVREVPLLNKEIRKSLKDLTNLWNSYLMDEKYILNIYSHYTNIPEGHNSIIMEYCSYGNLKSVMNNIGALPESVIKYIAMNTIKGLDTYHNNVCKAYGFICPNNILFDNENNLKLSIGIRHLFNDNEKFIKNKFFYSNLKIRQQVKTNWMNKINSKNITINDNEIALFKVMRRLDIFDLGLMMINCAIGDIELIDFNKYVCDHDINKCCCLYHCIEITESSKRIKLTNIINEKKFSKHFINFLCCTTSYSYKKNSPNKIKNHDWFINNKDKILLNINELLVLSKEYQIKKNKHLQKNVMQKFASICESLKLVLSFCDYYFQHQRVTNSNFIFNEDNEKNLQLLSEELGIERELLISHIKPIFDIVFK